MLPFNNSLGIFIDGGFLFYEENLEENNDFFYCDPKDKQFYI
jgi:hypothetical protein